MIEIYTTGYSTRKLDAWIRMVKKHGIEMLIDVRTMGTKQVTANRPELSKESLSVSLPEDFDIEYHLIPKLGGYRTFRDTGIEKKYSPNLALSKENGFSSDAFRTFADYMYMNESFLEGINELLDIARTKKVAYFCCEGWERKCHRNLISDYLTAFNLAKVCHIKSGVRADEHQRIEFGVVHNDKLIYPIDYMWKKED